MRVYQLSMEFVDRINALIAILPRGNSALVDQLKRAALSIPTNIAEGFGRRQVADRRHFFLIVRGSVNECVPLVSVAAKLCALEVSQYTKLHNEMDLIAKMLTALIATLQK